MKIDSLYITQSAVIGLANIPLELNENIRRSFQPIFSSKNCFADMGPSIYDEMRVGYNIYIKNYSNENEQLTDNDAAPIPVTKAPFISNMGQVCFNTRSMYFLEDSYLREEFAYQLGKRIAYWRNFEHIFTNPRFDELEECNTFGYNVDLKDQRMNFLYFELRPPFKLLAQYRGKTVASGNIFVHIYPTGYIVLHLAVYMRDIEGTEIESETDLLDLLHETKPWLDGKWKWKSKFGCYSLKETFDQVFENISMSIFTEGKLAIGMLKWKPSIAIKADLEQYEINPSVLEEQLAGSHYVKFRGGYYGDSLAGIFIAKKNRNYYIANTYRTRRSILHSFWKLNHINEFLLYKSKVYDDYLKYIRKDRNELRELKLNKKYKFKTANIIGKDFYKDTLYAYTMALDDYVTELGPNLRALYTLISKVDGFDDKRTKLKAALEEWIDDIKDWDSKETYLKKFGSILLDAVSLLKKPK